MKKIAILQSNYIPWKGYFDLISSVDEFFFYDEVQYTKQDWRNRNKIKTEGGLKWISVPVTVNGLYEQKVSETHIANKKWGKSHWGMLQQAYRKSKYFDELSALLKPFFLESSYDLLIDLNRDLIHQINSHLEIDTVIKCSSELDLEGDRNERLVDLCNKVNADVYVSGPAAKSYLSEELFASAGVKVEWFDYAGYAEYPQLWGGFEHYVTVLDLLFNVGPNAKDFITRSL